LGAEIAVDLPIGKVKIKIPEGSSGGKRLRFSNKGFIRSDKTRGDLNVELRIILPQKLSGKEKQLYEQLQVVTDTNFKRVRGLTVI